MINFERNIYRDIEDEYFKKIKDQVYSNYNTLKVTTPQSDLFTIIPDKKCLKNILIRNIKSNNQGDSVVSYRKSLTFSSIRINGMFKLKDKSQSQIDFYKKLRGELIKKYDNPILTKILAKIPDTENPYNSNQNFINFQKKIDKHFDSINKELEKIFDYNKLLSSDTELRAKILIQTNIFVCPYCNRQFISKYEMDGKNRSTAQLDHFYPKSKFPLFALSLYNFVPICSICNSIFKRSKVNDTIYPFNNRNNTDHFFKINYHSTEGIQGANTNFEIEIGIPDNLSSIDRILFQKANKDLGISELYNSAHKDFVAEINMKRNLKNQSYISYIKKLLDTGSVPITELDLILFGYDQSDHELLKKPLSKLAHDLLK